MRYERPVRDWTTTREKTRELAELERLRQEMIKACAQEWARLMSLSDEAYWSKAIPQALYDALVGFDRGASRAAAQAFLEDHPLEEEEE